MGKAVRRFVVRSNFGTQTYTAFDSAEAEDKHRVDVTIEAPELLKDLKIESVVEEQISDPRGQENTR